MDPVHWHLALVHLPVVGLPFALAGWGLAWHREDAFWRKCFEGLWLLLVLAAAGAYATGGWTYERLSEAGSAAGAWSGQALAETHALAGRASLMVMVFSAAVLLQSWIRRAQGDVPGRNLHLLLLLLGVIACALLLFTAWLGGPVGHVELR